MCRSTNLTAAFQVILRKRHLTAFLTVSVVVYICVPTWELGQMHTPWLYFVPLSAHAALCRHSWWLLSFTSPFTILLVCKCTTVLITSFFIIESIYWLSVMQKTCFFFLFPLIKAVNFNRCCLSTVFPKGATWISLVDPNFASKLACSHDCCCSIPTGAVQPQMLSRYKA